MILPDLLPLVCVHKFLGTNLITYVKESVALC